MRRVLITWDHQPTITYSYARRMVRKGKRAILDHGGIIENDLQIVLGFVAIVTRPSIDALLFCSGKYRPVVEYFPINEERHSYIVPPADIDSFAIVTATAAPVYPLALAQPSPGSPPGVPSLGPSVAVGRAVNATADLQPVKPMLVKVLDQVLKETRAPVW